MSIYSEQDKWIDKDGKKLRIGYTTGTCALAGVLAGLEKLFFDVENDTVKVDTLAGHIFFIPVTYELEENAVKVSVIKDSGDDPDVTNNICICTQVSLYEADNFEVTIDGGKGIGRVTKEGLDQPVGNAAINSTPRNNIKAEALKLAKKASYNSGIKVYITAVNGEEIAKKTFNPKLGITGGISILGTTGIVEPMSDLAVIETIKLHMNMIKKSGFDKLIITPGNYGEKFIIDTYKMKPENLVLCSNFIGDALDCAIEKGFKEVHLVGHVGKLVKLSNNTFNTHSRYGDNRKEVFIKYAKLNAVDETIIEKLNESVMTDDMIHILQESPKAKKVMKDIMDSILENLRTYVKGKIIIKLTVFSNVYGVLND